MNINIDSVATLGLAIRATRRSSDVRLDDLAATCGVSKQFVSELEHGKPGVSLGLVLKLLAELGVTMHIDIPRDAGAALEVAAPLKPLKKRKLLPTLSVVPAEEHKNAPQRQES